MRYDHRTPRLVKDKIRDPIFVVGMARSGTTLLQCLLAASPGAFSLPETHFFSEVLHRLSKSGLQPLTSENFSLALSMLQERMALEVPAGEFETLQIQAVEGGLTGQDLFEFVLELYRPPDDHGQQLRVIEKTPAHVQCIPQIHALYPGAKFVHIVRDPRNVISSLLNTPFAQSRWIPWYTERWNRILDMASEFDASVPDTITTIRYEDLVENTAASLRAVCEFLDLRYVPEMLTAFSNQLTRSTVMEREPWKQKVKSGQICSERDAWKRRITPGQAWYIERETQSRMKVYGYPFMASPAWLKRVQTRWQIWTLPRRDPKALDMCANLAFRYAESGDLSRAGKLAIGTVFGNWKWLRNRTIRRALSGYVRLILPFPWGKTGS